VARQAEALGPFDSIIHNAAIYRGAERRTSDGVTALFAVNVLAPYLLTAEIALPHRLVYLSSGMHLGARAQLDDASQGVASYSESKLYVLMLSYAVARLHPQARSNGVDPGWVPTRMGGAGAPDDLEQGAETQAELAAPSLGSHLADATGGYFHHMRALSPHPQSLDTRLQDRLLEICRERTGIALQ
jgi:NAD(P)-dependent dehydrogenase (short-subunit alcohol dehydrogenase family)